MFILIQSTPSSPQIYMGDTADVSGTDEQINAKLPYAPPGTIIAEAGFKNMKQKNANSEWKSFSGET